MAQSTNQTEDKARSSIAFWVLLLSGGGLLLVSIAAIWFAKSEDRAETTRLVFASITPLLGTWVGAVIAYYFSSANLRAGSETALAAVSAAGGLTPETPVTQVMTPLSRIHPVQRVDDDTAARALKLTELYGTMKDAGRGRVPILNMSDVPLYVVHEQDIDEYSGSKPANEAVASKNLPDTATVGLLIEEFASQLRFAVVKETATLADARSALNAVDGAKDVFITADGTTSSAVKGWLTNSDLAKSV
jgi:hypothetical protein